jgi:hypothetical protein
MHDLGVRINSMLTSKRKHGMKNTTRAIVYRDPTAKCKSFPIPAT